jgi:hypothetical protein
VAATRANLRGGAPRRYIRSKPAQFALGHAYTDREAFIDAFVARVSILQCADGPTAEALVAELERDGHWVRVEAEIGVHPQQTCRADSQ